MGTGTFLTGNITPSGIQTSTSSNRLKYRKRGKRCVAWIIDIQTRQVFYGSQKTQQTGRFTFTDKREIQNGYTKT